MDEPRGSLFRLVEELRTAPPCYERLGGGFWSDPWSSRKAAEIQLNRSNSEGGRTAERAEQQVQGILARLPRIPARAVDLGCGAGHHATALASRGVDVRGIDISPAIIEHARSAATAGESAGRGRREFLLGSFFDLPWGSEAPELGMLLFGEFSLLTREERLRFLRRARKELAPGGHLFLELFSQDAAAVPRERNWEYAPGEGFWAAEAYVELNVTEPYPREEVVLHRFGLLFADGSVREERIWESSVDPDRLGDELREANLDRRGPPLELRSAEFGDPRFGEEEGELGRSWYLAHLVVGRD